MRPAWKRSISKKDSVAQKAVNTAKDNALTSEARRRIGCVRSRSSMERMSASVPQAQSGRPTWQTRIRRQKPKDQHENGRPAVEHPPAEMVGDDSPRPSRASNTPHSRPLIRVPISLPRCSGGTISAPSGIRSWGLMEDKPHEKLGGDEQGQRRGHRHGDQARGAHVDERDDQTAPFHQITQRQEKEDARPVAHLRRRGDQVPPARAGRGSKRQRFPATAGCNTRLPPTRHRPQPSARAVWAKGQEIRLASVRRALSTVNPTGRKLTSLYPEPGGGRRESVTR